MLIHNQEKTTLCAQLLDESICVLDVQAFFFKWDINLEYGGLPSSNQRSYVAAEDIIQFLIVSCLGKISTPQLVLLAAEMTNGKLKFLVNWKLMHRFFWLQE